MFQKRKNLNLYVQFVTCITGYSWYIYNYKHDNYWLKRKYVSTKSPFILIMNDFRVIGNKNANIFMLHKTC